MAPEFNQLLDHLPLIPESVLRQHKVHQPLDTRFRAAARLLQAIWREDRDLPIGSYVRADGRTTRLGSRLSGAAGRAGENFLSKEIAALAFRETCYREIGAMIDENRLCSNLLSSMPLTFNLFGPLRLDPALALAMLRHFVPEVDADATQVLFEHSFLFFNTGFTEYYTAFDALIRYRTVHGRRGFVAFEVKYSETCAESIKPTKKRYQALSRASGLFVDPDSDALRNNPLQQLWREHCLAQSMVANGLYDEGHFILIGPRLNHLVQGAAEAYGEHLAEPTEGKVSFANLHLENLIEALGDEGQPDYAQQLHRRYCDFWLVDGEIELALAEQSKPRQRKGKKALVPSVA